MKKMLVLIPAAVMLFAFTYVAPETKPWIAPASAKKLKNPVTTSKKSSSAKAGKKIFKSRCVACHGAAGKGDGPGGKALNPKPANLTSYKVQKQVDGEIYWKITNGRGAMVKWEGILSKTDRWNLVNYIRTIKASK